MNSREWAKWALYGDYLIKELPLHKEFLDRIEAAIKQAIKDSYISKVKDNLK